MSVSIPPRTFSFGPDGSMVGSITRPAKGASRIGAVIWGMGVAELRVARSLAKLGVVTLQVRYQTFAQFDASGVIRCKAAMDELKATHGMDSFILMGNCGSASVCFNTALNDRRVIGLVLMNPHVSEGLTVAESYKRRLLTWASWRRLLTGKASQAWHRARLRSLKVALLARLRRVDERSLIAAFPYNQDLTLPDNIGERIKSLVSRSVKTLIIFSTNDASLDYFKKAFGKTFAKLGSSPALSMQVIPRTAHTVSTDDVAAGMVTEIVSKWATDATFRLGSNRDSAVDTAVENEFARRVL